MPPVPAGVKVKQFRDFQAALQPDRVAGRISDSVGASVSMAGYYQYMADQALITIPAGAQIPGTGIELPGQAGVLLAEKGHIGVAQAKITLSIRGTPLKVPLALTWANRTELIKA